MTQGVYIYIKFQWYHWKKSSVRIESQEQELLNFALSGSISSSMMICSEFRAARTLGWTESPSGERLWLVWKSRVPMMALHRMRFTKFWIRRSLRPLGCAQFTEVKIRFTSLDRSHTGHRSSSTSGKKFKHQSHHDGHRLLARLAAAAA